MKICIAALIVCVLILGSCTKHVTKPSPTVFSLHCSDDLTNPIPGVTVNLYNDSTDWANGTNIIYSAKTNDSGNVSFTGIPSQRYYFSCHDTANCWINKAAYFTGNPVAPNTTTAVGLTLTAYGTLAVKNTSANKSPYEIKINGKVWQASLAYGQTITKILPVQTYSVESIQLSGFIGYGADISYGITVNQCASTLQDIP